MPRKVSSKIVVYKKKRSSARKKRGSVVKKSKPKRNVRRKSKKRSPKQTSVVKHTRKSPKDKRALVARKLKVSLEKFCKSRMSNIIKKSIVNRKVRKSLKKKLEKSLKKLKMMGGQGKVPKRVSKRPPPIKIPKVRVISDRLQAIELFSDNHRKLK